MACLQLLLWWIVCEIVLEGLLECLVAHATIQFALPEDAQVRLVVYDVMGRAVAEVANGAFPAGFHRVSVDTGALASGTYVYRLTTPVGAETRRLTVIR